MIVYKTAIKMPSSTCYKTQLASELGAHIFLSFSKKNFKVLVNEASKLLMLFK